MPYLRRPMCSCVDCAHWKRVLATQGARDRAEVQWQRAAEAYLEARRLYDNHIGIPSKEAA